MLVHFNHILKLPPKNCTVIVFPLCNWEVKKITTKLCFHCISVQQNHAFIVNFFTTQLHNGNTIPLCSKDNTMDSYFRCVIWSYPQFYNKIMLPLWKFPPLWQIYDFVVFFNKKIAFLKVKFNVFLLCFNNHIYDNLTSSEFPCRARCNLNDWFCLCNLGHYSLWTHERTIQDNNEYE